MAQGVRSFCRCILGAGVTAGEDQRAAVAGSGEGLGRWRVDTWEADQLSGPHPDDGKEVALLRKEKQLLRQKRDLPKKSGRISRDGDHKMRCRVIEVEKAKVPSGVLVRC